MGGGPSPCQISGPSSLQHLIAFKEYKFLYASALTDGGFIFYKPWTGPGVPATRLRRTEPLLIRRECALRVWEIDR